MDDDTDEVQIIRSMLSLAAQLMARDKLAANRYIFALSVISGVPAGCLLCFHLFIAAQAKTTFEHTYSTRRRDLRLENIEAMFGTTLLEALAPPLHTKLRLCHRWLLVQENHRRRQFFCCPDHRCRRPTKPAHDTNALHVI